MTFAIPMRALAALARDPDSLTCRVARIGGEARLAVRVPRTMAINQGERQ